MALLRSSAPQHTRDAHGEYIAARTVALRLACDEGARYYTVRRVGRMRCWRWYAVTADYIDGTDTPFASEREGRAWTPWGASRAALAWLDPLRAEYEALRALRYAHLGPCAAYLVRVLDTFVPLANILCAVGLVAYVAAVLTGWSGATALLNAMLFAFAVPCVAARVLATVLSHRARNHAEEIR